MNAWEVEAPVLRSVEDTAAVRKVRGAFFTPPELCRYVVDWAVRTEADHVLEPACGEAAFLLAGAARLDTLGRAGTVSRRAAGRLHGVELHAGSAQHAAGLLHAAGHEAHIDVADFFTLDPRPAYDAVVGNPPYVRYQDFTGEARLRSRAAALRAGVALTNLSSSWAAFTVHASLFLRPGGRLGLVLPAELLTVNYAAQVRRFLLERFRTIRLVLFTERVFPGAMVEVVLLLADGYGQGPSRDAELYQARNVADLPTGVGRRWRPERPDGKWMPSLLADEALAAYEALRADERMTTLGAWGDTTLGMVTGNNRYFAMSPATAGRWGIGRRELLALSPPGSAHLRGLALTREAWRALGRAGRATYLFRPAGEPSAAAVTYLEAGRRDGVEQAYKCRVRTPWWRVPYVPPADVLLTYMNADTPRLCANEAGVHHVNSVHGVYLRDDLQETGRALLPVAALNSMTLLGAELVGRAYGGGMLKLEPREADVLPVPAPALVAARRSALSALRPRVAARLRGGDLLGAVRLVDDALLVTCAVSARQVTALRQARAELHARRVARGADPDRGGAEAPP